MNQHNYAIFKRKLEAFSAWLTSRGAELLTPTNEWEVLRFRTDKATSIVYSKKSGDLTFVGESSEAYRCFLGGHAWRAFPKTVRTKKSTPTCAALRKRDGDACFYCHLPVAVEDESIEHLVAATHGGPDHIANMVLAHARPCNAEAGHLSVMEKIRLRERGALRTEIKTPDTPPWEL